MSTSSFSISSNVKNLEKFYFYLNFDEETIFFYYEPILSYIKIKQTALILTLEVRKE